MAEKTTPEEVIEEIRGKVDRGLKAWLGPPLYKALIIIVLAVASLFWGWEHIEKNVPVLSRLWDALSPVKRAEAGKYTVVVARLEGDTPNNHYQHIIAVALRDWQGLEAIEERKRLEARADGAEAKQWLAKSGAQALIWGEVLGTEGTNKIVRLHWYGGEAAGMQGRRYGPDAVWNMPDLFWDDLKTVLMAVVSAHASSLHDDPDPDLAQRLRPHVERMQSLVAEAGAKFKAQDQAKLRVMLGNALRALGEMERDPGRLEQAVTIYGDAIPVFEACGAPHYANMCRRNLVRAQEALVRLQGDHPGKKQ